MGSTKTQETCETLPEVGEFWFYREMPDLILMRIETESGRKAIDCDCGERRRMQTEDFFYSVRVTDHGDFAPVGSVCRTYLDESMRPKFCIKIFNGVITQRTEQ